MASMDIAKEKTKAASQKIKERDFWLSKLAGEWHKTAFYYDYPEGKGPAVMERLPFVLSEESFSALMRLRNDSDHRLFMILAAQLIVLLYRYTGQKDILLGAPIYRQEIEGHFINTLLTLRNTFEPAITFKQLLLQFRQTLLEAAEHQNYPVEALLHKLNLPIPGDEEDFPLFDIAVLLENVHDPAYIKHIHTNLVFRFRRSDTAVEGVVAYNSVRYHADSVQRIIRHYQYLVQGMTGALDTPLRDIEILSEEEKKQLLVDFNNTAGDYPEGKTLHQWFEEQAELTPDRPALFAPGYNEPGAESRAAAATFGSLTLTYRRLNEKANQLARLLRSKGVEAQPTDPMNTIVALMTERSLEMIVSLLAILKAGGAYLPIDTNYPEERKKYMLTDSKVPLLLTNHGPEKPAFVPEGIEVIDAGSPALYNNDETNLPHSTNAGHLAYLIYTSGSTGQPRGVMLEHKNGVNLIHFDFNHTNLDFSKVLQFHTIGFDASFHEIFCALLSGGELYLVREEDRLDIPALFQIVEQNRIPTVFLPMSFLRIIFNDEQYASAFPHCVRHIQTAGEQVVINNRFRRFLLENHVYLHNHYGPSETHVVTALTIDPDSPIPELPTIGKPILNTTAYILDKDQQLVPVGVPGELCIGGLQVGRGYLYRPELTAEKFIMPPAARGAFLKNRPPGPPEKLLFNLPIYRTGDLARWMEDGNIEFLGRIDTQVKIRGFRIEPGEIETRLMDVDYIKEAVVIDKTDEKGEKYLCAYVVSDAETNPAELRDILAKTLPDYMVPSYIVQIEQIPLSPNGKVKRDALPDIEDAASTRPYTPPRDDVEKQLCRLWADVLSLEKENIGIDDNFFELGGHSLRATILISKIHKTFNVKLILGQLFSQPTVRGLAQVLKDAKRDTFRAIEPAGEKPYYPMSSAQKRMYIVHQLEKESLNYNMPAPMIVDGPADKNKFESVFRQLIRRQEGLRTRFVVREGEAVQEIAAPEEVEFAVQYETGSEIDREIDRFVRPFDLAKAPLFRVGLVKLAPEKFLLLVDFHHIIGDGVSMGVLIREFTRIYEGEEPTPLRIQYRDYALWQQRLVESGELKRQEQYWLNQLDGDIPVLNLPLDYPRPAKMSFEGQWLDFEISPEVTGKLKKIADQHDATLYMVLLAAYNVLLHKYTGRETIIVGSVTAGRSHPDLENIIGVFLNTLAMKNNPSDSLAFTRFLEQVGENALRAYENQDYQFEELVEKLNLKRDYSRNPVFDTMLNFINMDIPAIELGGLKITPYKMESEAVKFDIKINAREQDGLLRCTLDYSGKLFKPDTMESFIDNFLRILDRIAEDPTVKISDIRLMSEKEERKMVEEFSKELEYDF